MSKPTIYIETSVISYLVAKPSRDIIVAANQQVTHEWWEKHLDGYDAFVSEFVIQEVSAGDKEYAKLRLNSISLFPVLEIDQTSIKLANHFIQTGILPNKAMVDAIHISCCAINQIQYIITWNCKHIANAHIRSKMDKECTKLGYNLPTISTPLVFLGEDANVD